MDYDTERQVDEEEEEPEGEAPDDPEPELGPVRGELGPRASVPEGGRAGCCVISQRRS